MKNILFLIYKFLLGAVIFGKVLNWFLKFDEATNQILNVAMYGLIGIAFLVMGYAWDKKIIRIIITACGIFLIIFNFIPPTTYFYILGIICIVVPFLIARFHKEDQEENKSV